MLSRFTKFLLVFLIAFPCFAIEPLPEFSEESLPGFNDDLRKSLENLPPQKSDLDMGTHKITDVVDPTEAQDAATKEYHDANSVIVQVVNVQVGDETTGTTAIPIDDTKPQKTEGDEYMTLAITPTSATNKLKIDVVCLVNHSTGTEYMTAALFQDTTTDALAAMGWEQDTAEGGVAIVFTHYMTAGTTSSTTFKVRAGGHTGATTTFNGRAGGGWFDGIAASSITITEITP